MTSRPRDAAGCATTADGTPDDTAPTAREPLPDLLGLSLGELRRLDHPVLNEVLDELRDRMVTPGETLWQFSQAW
jgi:FXSXX-COOH protein